MNNDSIKTKEQLIGELESLRKRSKEKEDELMASNQQLLASEQQLKAANQQLSASEQQLQATNQQLSASEQQLRATNQQFQAANQQLSASEQELKQQRDLLIEAQKIAHISHWTFDPEAGIPWWSEELYKIYGIDPAEGPLSYEDHPKLIHPDDWEWYDATVQYTAKTGKPFDIILRILRPSGEIRYINSICQPLLDTSGAVIEMRGTIQDITESKLAEIKIIQKQYHLENAQAMGKIGSWDLDIALNELIWTDENYRIFGIPSGTPMTYELFLNCIHPDDREYVDKKWNAAMRGEEAYDINHRLLMENGEVKWVREKADLIFDANGDCLRGTGFTQDITERKQAEKKLIESESSVRRKLNAIAEPDGDFSNLRLSDIIDSEALQSMMDDLAEMTGMCAGIADLEGHILASAGWRDVCSQYHRKHPETLIHCVESDTIISQGVAPGDFKLYKCKNHLWESASPITIAGQHVGNIYLGQFFYEDEEVDLQFFKKQANKCGFNENDYLTAIKQVPRFSREKVEHAIQFFAEFAQMISVQSYNNIRLSRALSQVKHSEKALRNSEHRLKESQKIAAIGNYEHNIETGEKWWSEELYRILEFDISKPSPSIEEFSKRLEQEDVVNLQRLMQNVISTGKSDSLIYKIQLPSSGTYKYISTKAELYTDELSNGKFIKGTLQDVTERIEVEQNLKQSEEKFRNLVENLQELVYRYELYPSPHFSYVSPNSTELIGYTPQEHYDNPNLGKEIIHPDDMAIFEKYMAEDLDTKKSLITRWTAKNGDIIWTEQKTTPIYDAENKMLAIEGISRNITTKVLAEKELKASEEKFRGVFEVSNVGIAIGTPQGDVIEVNDEYLKITGYTREEFVNINFADISHPNDLEKELPLFEQLHKGEIDNYRIEKRLKTKNGGYVWLDSAITAQKDGDGKIEKTLAFVVDITEVKKANETVDAFFEQPMNIHLMGTIEGEILRVNDGWSDILGYSKDEVVGKKIFDFIHPDDLETTLSEITDLKEGKKIFYFENRYMHKNGNYVLLTWSATYNTTIKLIHGIAKDITQQEAYQKKLEQSEERYKALSENAKHIIFTHSFDGEISYANQYALDFINLPKEQVIGSNIKLMIQDEAEIEKMEERIKEVLIGNSKVHQFILNFTLPSGDKKILEVIGSPILQNGQIGSFLLTAYDITERENARLELTDRETKLKNIIENSTNLFYTHSVGSEVTFISPQVKNILGYDPEEVMKRWTEFITDNPINEKAKEYTEKAIKTAKRQPTYEMEMRRKDGHKIMVEVREAPVVVNGKVDSIVGSLTDITKRKKAETKLRESEEKLRLAIENSPLGITINDMEGNFISTNKAYQRIVGYSEKELIGMSFFDITHKDYLPKNKALFKAMASDKEPGFSIDKKYVHKSGRLIDVRINAGSIHDEDGKPLFGMAFTEDISEEKAAREELQKLYDELSVIYENDPTFIIFKDTKNNILHVTDSVAKMTGLPKEKIEGKPSKEIYPDMADKYYQDDLEVMQSGKPKMGIIEALPTADGQTKWLLTNKIPYLDKNQQLKGIILFSTDITQLKRNEERFKRAERIGKLGNWEYDVESQTFWGSEEAKALYGFKPEKETFSLKEVGNRILDKEKTNKALMDLIEKDTPYNLDFDIEVLETGEKRSLHSVAIAVKNSQEKTIKVRGVNQDITERKALEQKNSMLSKAIESSPITVVITDKEGDIEYVNPHFTNVTGYTSDEAIGENPRILKSGDQDEAFYKELWQTLTSGNTWIGEFHNKKKNGELYWENAAISPVVNNEGEIIQFIAVKEDITELKQSLSDLKIAKDKAEESDRLKSAFLSNMSHEIRTPMNGILGFTSLLKESQLTGDTRDKYIKIIEKSGKRMLSTINDIVDISKIEAGQVEVLNKELSINNLLAEQYSFFVRESKAKGLELIYNPIVSDSESIIISDQHKLEGILTNLIKNAIKYTESGSITFGYSIKTINGYEACEFYVKDSGIGIPANRLKAIFNRFEQADIEDTRVFEGSGLGLAISKSYIEMLGGTISVSSKEGKGSTFTFHIPCIKQTQKESTYEQNGDERTELSLNNLSIIVAEDDEVSKILLETILENDYSKISYTSTGTETVEMCRENPDTDIILMDIKMPDMNGFRATELIRKFNKDVIIIAQTAYGLAGDKEKALKVGCDEYIAKPIKRTSLLDKIQLCLIKRGMK